MVLGPALEPIARRAPSWVIRRVERALLPRRLEFGEFCAFPGRESCLSLQRDPLGS